MSNPILSRVLDRVAEGLHPSAVHVSPNGPGAWRVAISLSDLVPLGEGGGPATVDRKDMPCGVLLTGWESYPDDVVSLAGVSDEVVETWVREVARSGRAPDVAKVGENWMTKPIEWLKEPMRSILLRKYYPEGAP